MDEFIEAIIKFGMAVTAVLAVLLLMIGVVILLIPGTLFKILLYAVGIVCVVCAILFAVSLIRCWLAYKFRPDKGP